MKIVYLRKASDEVISFCACGDGRITFPAQMDCPWCGCGWLFSCITCRKAFTFAEGVEVDSTWEELAREDRRGMWKEEPSEEEVTGWVGAMKALLAEVRVGQRYVIIDGTVIPADAENIAFDGWHASHAFAVLPQIEALSDKAVLKVQLSNRDYWAENALPQDDEE